MEIPCPALFADFLPGLCRAVDHYCERTSTAFDAEPINALTNLAFPFGALILWWLYARQPLKAGHGLIRTLIIVMATVGFGSLLFHVVGQRWAEWADVIPILVFILLYLWFLLTYFFQWRTVAKCLFLFFFLSATVGLEALAPGDFLWGGALFIPTLATFVTIGAALCRSQHPAGSAMLVSMTIFLCAFAFRSLDHAICSGFPLGTHFLWHLLNALLLFLLIRLAMLSQESC